METKNVPLIHQQDYFTSEDLYRRVAEKQGVDVNGLEFKHDRAYSRPFATIKLDDQMLAHLAQRGIKQQSRGDLREEIFTLVDEGPKDLSIPRDLPQPTTYWNFKRIEGTRNYDLAIHLAVSLDLSMRDRGIKIYPRAYGTFVSAASDRSQMRMFTALVEHASCGTYIALEIARLGGPVLVTFTDIGLGGLRMMWQLFEEFAGQNESIKELGRSKRGVFDPEPYPPHGGESGRLFIVESAHARILDAWDAQLENYLAQLKRA